MEEENTISNQLSVYPNPVSDKLYIRNITNGLKNAAVSIVDINGQLIKKVLNVNENQYIDISELAKGYYLLRIETAEGVAFKKIVKE